MLPYQARVVAEKEQLDERMAALLRFIVSPTYGDLDAAEKRRLRAQLWIMADYSDILGERIAAFTVGQRALR